MSGSSAAALADETGSKPGSSVAGGGAGAIRYGAPENPGGAPIVIKSEGEPVEARLYQPRESTGRPAIVVSPSRVTTVAEMGWLARALLARGYTVLVQGYRRSVNRYQIRDVADVRSAVTWLQGNLRGEGVHIGLVGHSRGGSASLRAAAMDRRVESTVALCAPIDIARYMNGLREHSPSRYDMLVKAYGATPTEDPEYYRAISPLHYAGRIASPVLLIHGSDDMVAPKENSEWMYEALVASGNANARLELIAGAGHFFEHRFQAQQFEPIVEFIDQWFMETL
jgi:dipeptidyl aminopeptidase/acylaminoacyl peptidase